ncbi:hypothetical protein [Microbacterium sp. PM5]|uniref:hypothetical protein n=1 Tax=Microbacterium sp. PM5 TaxID=2014534 RepID=UPI0013AEF94D|nr:hypothetical protein [Microbacterium sp. PM5]
MAVTLWALLALLTVAIVKQTKPDRNGVRPLVTAGNLVALLSVFYILMPGLGLILANAEFTWAPSFGGWDQLSGFFGVTIVGLTLFNLGYYLVQNRKPTRPRLADRPSATRATGPGPLEIIVVVACLVIGLALKAYLVQSTGGVVSTLLRLSSSVRESTNVGDLDAGDLSLRTASGLADVAAVWIFIRSLSSKRAIAPATALLVAVMLISFTTAGKRLTLLLPILAVVVALSVVRMRLSIRLFPVLVSFAFAFGMGTLLFRIYVPAWLNNVTINLDQVPYAHGSVFLFYMNSLEFSTVEMSTLAINARDSIVSMFGGYGNSFYELNIVPFLYTIPRGIWFDKPDTIYDLSYAVSAIARGFQVPDPTVGYVTTLIGNSYVMFGPLGVAASFALFGLAAGCVDRMRFRRASWTPASLIGYSVLLVLVFHVFRMGSLGWTFLIGVVQQYGFLLGFGLLALASAMDRAWLVGRHAERAPLRGHHGRRSDAVPLRT